MSRKRLIFFILFPGILFILISSIFVFPERISGQVAVTYHVRTDGSDTLCNGTANASAASAPNCAFATPQRGANAVTCGSTVLIHAGTYTSCPTLAGGSREVILGKSGLVCTAATRATVRGAGDGQVILQATDLGGGNYCDHAVYLNDVQYVTVGGIGANQGFTIQGDYDHNGSAGDSGGNIFGFGAIQVYGDSSYVSIFGHTVFGSTLPFVTANRDKEIYIRHRISGGVPVDPPFIGYEVAYNYVEARAAENAFGMGTSDQCENGGCVTPVATNRIHHNSFVHSSTVGNHRMTAIGVIGCSDCDIYNNYLRAGDNSNQAIDTSFVFYNRDNRRLRFYNNFVELHGSHGGSGANGIFFQDTSDAVVEDQWIYNNTFYGEGVSAIRFDNTNNTEIRNNLFMSLSPSQPFDGALGYLSTGGSGTVIGYNAAWNTPIAGCLTGATCEGNNVTINPQIVGSGAIPAPFL